MRLRQAKEVDAPELARLSTQLGYAMNAQEMASRLKRLLADPAHHILVACGQNGQLAGWIHVESRFSLEGGAKAEIMGLVVDTSARRQGVGRALVKLAEAWAGERGLSKITVRSNTIRKASHPFYEACDYRQAKSQVVYAKPVLPGNVSP